MITSTETFLHVRFHGGFCSEWWQNTNLIRKGPQEWYIYQDNSYMYIAYIDSIPIEDRYQYLLNKQPDLFDDE